MCAQRPDIVGHEPLECFQHLGSIWWVFAALAAQQVERYATISRAGYPYFLRTRSCGTARLPPENEGFRNGVAGKPIGTVARLLALPSCEVLEVSRDGAQELLVPLIGDAVRDVDIARRSIEIDLQFLGEES